MSSSESYSLLQKTSTNSYNALPEKILCGGGLLLGLGGAGYEGFNIVKNGMPGKSDWIAIGAIVALVGISVFGLVRAFMNNETRNSESRNSERKSEDTLSNVTVQSSLSDPSSDLNMLCDKIDTISTPILNNKVHDKKGHSSLSQDSSKMEQALQQLDVIQQFLGLQTQALQKAGKESKEKLQDFEALEAQLQRVTLSHEKEREGVSKTQLQLEKKVEELEKQLEETTLSHKKERASEAGKQKKLEDEIQELNETLESKQEEVESAEFSLSLYNNQLLQMLDLLGGPSNPSPNALEHLDLVRKILFDSTQEHHFTSESASGSPSTSRTGSRHSSPLKPSKNLSSLNLLKESKARSNINASLEELLGEDSEGSETEVKESK